ncbi:hypothetical protein ACG7TL_007255 [Trametes sanguinea]
MTDLSEDPAAAFFMLLWVVVLGLTLYSIISSCLHRTPSSTRPPGRPSWGFGPGSGWFPGTRPDAPDAGPNDPPPPYSKHPAAATNSAQAEGWRPGFWTGAALGGLGAYLFNRQPQGRHDQRVHPPMAPVPNTGMYDWEAERMFRRPRPTPVAPTWLGGSTRGRGGWEGDDRGHPLEDGRFSSENLLYILKYCSLRFSIREDCNIFSMSSPDQRNPVLVNTHDVASARRPWVIVTPQDASLPETSRDPYETMFASSPRLRIPW